RRRLMIAQTFLALVTGVGTQAQRPVVDGARAPKRPRQHGSLVGHGIEPIVVGALLLHAYDCCRNIVTSLPAEPGSCSRAHPTPGCPGGERKKRTSSLASGRGNCKRPASPACKPGVSGLFL